MRKFHYSTHKYNKIREVGFRVLGHDFRLVLSPKRGLLHSKFKAVEIVDDEGSGNQTELRIPIDHESFYEGRLFGELDSKASVHMEVQNNFIITIHFIWEEVKLDGIAGKVVRIPIPFIMKSSFYYDAK